MEAQNMNIQAVSSHVVRDHTTRCAWVFDPAQAATAGLPGGIQFVAAIFLPQFSCPLLVMLGSPAPYRVPLRKKIIRTLTSVEVDISISFATFDSTPAGGSHMLMRMYLSSFLGSLVRNISRLKEFRHEGGIFGPWQKACASSD